MDKTKIFPGYFVDKPLFQAEKTFRRLLSEQDSCFHTNQVSLLFLEQHIENNGLDNSKFIRELCDKNSISAGHRSWEITKKLMARSYMVQTYNIQEIFFKEFNSEYRTYKKISNWKTKVTEGNSDKMLDPYSQLIENLPNENSSIFKNKPESHIIQYYRLVRNGIVHKSENSMDKPLVYYKNTIKPQQDYFKNYYNFLPDGLLPAPNEPNKLTHNDFFIYSRCLKNLINLIINACDLKVSEIFDFEIHNEAFLKTMKKHSQINEKAKSKMKETLSTFFTSKYGSLKAERLEFINKYIAWKQ